MKFSQILLCEFAIGSNCESEAKAKRKRVHFVRSEAKWPNRRILQILPYKIPMGFFLDQWSEIWPNLVECSFKNVKKCAFLHLQNVPLISAKRPSFLRENLSEKSYVLNVLSQSFQPPFTTLKFIEDFIGAII